jgi:uncharacterized protein Veg
VRPMPPRPDKTILFTRATVRMLLLFCRKKKVRSSEILGTYAAVFAIRSQVDKKKDRRVGKRHGTKLTTRHDRQGQNDQVRRHGIGTAYMDDQNRPVRLYLF